MPITESVLSRYLNPFFIETGSYDGDGIQTALNVGFNNIISIELSDHFFEVCKAKFINYEEVELVLGDSSKVLGSVLGKIQDSVTFWLDGHYSGAGTAMGDIECPLLRELELISRHPIKNHKILIDDMRLWRVNSIYGFGDEEIRRAILKINPTYKFNYENGYVKNDILVATVDDE